MSIVINMKTRCKMSETKTSPTEQELHEQAWNQLFAAIGVILVHARKPGFDKLGFKDNQNRVMSMPAVVRNMDRQLSLIRAAVSPVTPSNRGE